MGRKNLNTLHPELKPPNDLNQRTDAQPKDNPYDDYMENLPGFMMVPFKPEMFSQVKPEMIKNLYKSNFFNKDAN